MIKATKEGKIILVCFITYVIIIISTFTYVGIVTQPSYEDMALKALKDYQRGRYSVTYPNCKHMSRECESFFESIGINTTQAYGWWMNEDGEKIYHNWIVLHLPSGDYEFECTNLRFAEVSKIYTIHRTEEGIIHE